MSFYVGWASVFLHTIIGKVGNKGRKEPYIKVQIVSVRSIHIFIPNPQFPIPNSPQNCGQDLIHFLFLQPPPNIAPRHNLTRCQIRQDQRVTQRPFHP